MKKVLFLAILSLASSNMLAKLCSYEDAAKFKNCGGKNYCVNENNDGRGQHNSPGKCELYPDGPQCIC